MNNVIRIDKHQIKKLTSELMNLKIDNLMALSTLFDIYTELQIHHIQICGCEYKHCDCEISDDCKNLYEMINRMMEKKSN